MRPPDEVARELAVEWLGKADVDLSAASVLLSAGNLYEVVAFHAQQAAEKALKSYLVWHQVEFPKTHDISRLLALCASVETGLAESLADAAELTPYGVEYRYPGEYPPVSRKAAEDSFACAQAAVGVIAGRLHGESAR